MNKFKQLKNAIKNPPPERLAKIEYQSHMMQGIGIMFASTLLIYYGFWYIIFAFMFGVGISYAQGMSAYMKYKAIMQFREVPVWEKDFEKDISPTRRRRNIVSSVFTKLAWWISLIGSVITSYLFVGVEFWYTRFLAFPLSAILLHVVVYFFVLYYISFTIYKWRKTKEHEKKAK